MTKKPAILRNPAIYQVIQSQQAFQTKEGDHAAPNPSAGKYLRWIRYMSRCPPLINRKYTATPRHTCLRSAPLTHSSTVPIRSARKPAQGYRRVGRRGRSTSALFLVGFIRDWRVIASLLAAVFPRDGRVQLVRLRRDSGSHCPRPGLAAAGYGTTTRDMT